MVLFASSLNKGDISLNWGWSGGRTLADSSSRLTRTEEGIHYSSGVCVCVGGPLCGASTGIARRLYNLVRYQLLLKCMQHMPQTFETWMLTNCVFSVTTDNSKKQAFTPFMFILCSLGVSVIY